MEKKLFEISENIVKYCFAIFIVLYSISNILFSVHIDNLVINYVTYDFGIKLLNTVFVLSLVVLLYILIKNDFFGIKENRFIYVFLFICFVIGIIWILINDPILREYDDAYNSFRSAVSISNGNYSVLGFGTYINNYPNNIGMVTYDLIHIKLFGENSALYSIRIINLLFVLIGYFSLFKITKSLFKNRLVSCVCILLMFCSMQYVFYAFFIYGNCISYSLALFSVWNLLEYIEKDKIINLIISSIAIILSISIKMNSSIVMVAEVIYLFLHIIKTKKFIIITFILLMLAGTYGGTTGLQKFWGNKVGIDYSETKLPMICWIAYGVNYDSRNPGHYTNEFELYHYAHDFMQEYTTIEAKRFISGALTRFKESPITALKFYGEKFIASWANPQYEAFDQFRELNNSELSKEIIGGNTNDIIDAFWDASQTIISLGLLVFLIRGYKKTSLLQLVCAVVVLGGFFFHAVWEVKAIYLYQYFMYLLPYAAYGISILFKKDV